MTGRRSEARIKVRAMDLPEVRAVLEDARAAYYLRAALQAICELSMPPQNDAVTTREQLRTAQRIAKTALAVKV